MYKKMQESGLSEIIPLLCNIVICGRYPVFSHPESSQGAELGVNATAEGLAVGSPFGATLSSLKAHHLGGYDVMAWWLQRPLFTDMAGSIIHP